VLKNVSISTIMPVRSDPDCVKLKIRKSLTVSPLAAGTSRKIPGGPQEQEEEVREL
jgi:hypothetical protein